MVTSMESEMRMEMCDFVFLHKNFGSVEEWNTLRSIDTKITCFV